MKITKEQEARILELDPNFFKAKLEVGKWYKNTIWKDIIFIDNINERDEVKYYGFDNGEFKDERNTETYYGYGKDVKYWILATDREVEEALTKEAVKRGYTTEDTNCLAGLKKQKIEGNYYYCSSENRLYSANEMGGGKVLFQGGVWATKIETITKAEAEKLLNKTIV